LGIKQLEKKPGGARGNSKKEFEGKPSKVEEGKKQETPPKQKNLTTMKTANSNSRTDGRWGGGGGRNKQKRGKKPGDQQSFTGTNEPMKTKKANRQGETWWEIAGPIETKKTSGTRKKLDHWHYTRTRQG